MSSKAALLSCFIFLLASCKHENKKKEIIIGMDEEADTLTRAQTPFIKADSVFKDTAMKRNVLNHDPVSRDREATGQAQKNIPVFKSAGNLRQFIIEIKQFVAVNNKREMARHIKYPLNNSIKTVGDFFVN